MEIAVAIIDLKKQRKQKKRLLRKMQICIQELKLRIWLAFYIKKDKSTFFLVIEIDDVKKDNILIEKRLVFNYTLYKYIKYNLVYKIKQYFNYY